MGVAGHSWRLQSAPICSRTISFLAGGAQRRRRRNTLFSLKRRISRHIRQPTHFSHPELLEKDELLPGISKTEFGDRRRRLMEEISKTHSGMTNPNHVLIIPASTVRYMTQDIFYRFHQSNDFLYFTGLQEPDSVLIMESDTSSPLPLHKSIIYVAERNPFKEKWEGPMLGPDDAADFLGINKAHPLSELPVHLEEKYSKEGYSVWYYGEGESPHSINDSTDLIIHQHLLSVPRSRIASHHSLLYHIHTLRAVKSAGEIALMKRAGEIASGAFRKVISLTHHGVYEYELESHFEQHCRLEGAQRLAFVPVVAGGDRGCHIHYTTNELKLRDGQLVLLDAGAEYHGYVSDVTRTWPVNGRFTEAQRDLYEAVLRVKEECIKSCQVGVTLNYLHSVSRTLLVDELKKLNILPYNLNGLDLLPVLNSLYPHDLGHYLGMDVHDTPLLSHNVTLQPGMVVTIEPGVYIRRDFPIQDPTKAKEFQGLAVRIEDDVLVTSSGPQILNEGTPQTIEDITSLINNS